jgi:hypothetical protein
MQTKWYRSSKTMADDGSLHMDYIVDLCTLADAYYTLLPTLDLARRKLEEIVCTVGQDRGVVLLSNDGPTHYDAEQKCQVYDHENFSPLGDALIELHDMLTGITEHPADADDSLPITEEWLHGLGFKRDDERPYLWINDGGPPKAGGFDLCVWDDGDCTLEDPDNSIILNQCKTRGDLLRLLAAFGITPEKTNGQA